MSTLEIVGVGKRFGTAVALDNVTLTIRQGELFFLLGPSGCGKTTLLRVLAGLCEPDAGSVSFMGRDLLAIPVEKRNIGMVFQSYSLWPHMTVRQNVAYGLRLRKAPEQEIREKVRKALAMVDMAELGERRPGELSGGQQQRVALARALVYDADLVLLDEPLSNLDAKLRREMRREIRRIHDQVGVTMVYVTHDQEEAASMADRVALMRAGAVAQEGTPRDLYERPSSVYAAQFFGQANILRGTVRSVDAAGVEIDIGSARLRASLPAGAAVTPARAVACMIRPEALQLTEQTSGENVWPAVVQACEYNGAFEQCTLAANGSTLTATVLGLPAEGPRLKHGARMGLRIPPHAIHIIPGDSGP